MTTVQNQWNEFPKNQFLIATTYSFDWPTLEKVIANGRGDRSGSVVFADPGEYEKTAIPNPYPKYCGKTYNLERPEVSGSFHPKIGLGVGRMGEVLLLVGSHNLTEEGTRRNLELTKLMEIPRTDPHRPFLKGIDGFLDGLEKLSTSPQVQDDLKKFRSNLLDFSPGSTLKYTGEFLHSFETPILDQVMDKVQDIKEVTILTPTHSSNPQWIKETIQNLGGKATFIIDPQQGFSVTDDAYKTYRKFNIKRLDKGSYGRLHAKLFVFHTKAGNWVLYGSPNFSEAALGKNVANGGNVETAILLPPDKNEKWESLFEGDITIHDEKWTNINRYDPEFPEPTNRKLFHPTAFEDFNGYGIIRVPGLKNGDTYILRLNGYTQDINVVVENGEIKFKIPQDWSEPPWYELLQPDGKVLEGYINRSSIVPVLEGLEEKGLLRRKFWHFSRRLQAESNWPTYLPPNELPPDTIDPNGWEPSPPIPRFRGSRRHLIKKPERYYDRAENLLKSNLKDFESIKKSKHLVDSWARSFLRRLDLTLEASFLSILIKPTEEYLVKNAYYLSKEIFEVEEYSNRKTHSYKPQSPIFSMEVVDDIRDIAPNFSLCLSVLINYWLYIEIKAKYNPKIRSDITSQRDYVINTRRY